jgi:hypothetical protein
MENSFLTGTRSYNERKLRFTKGRFSRISGIILNAVMDRFTNPNEQVPE